MRKGTAVTFMMLGAVSAARFVTETVGELSCMARFSVELVTARLESGDKGLPIVAPALVTFSVLPERLIEELPPPAVMPLFAVMVAPLDALSAPVPLFVFAGLWASSSRVFTIKVPPVTLTVPVPLLVEEE